MKHRKYILQINLLTFQPFVLSLTHAQTDAKKHGHELLPAASKSLTNLSKRSSKAQKMQLVIYNTLLNMQNEV